MKALVELNGEFTYARLKARYTEAQIGEAVRTGLLRVKPNGIYVIENRKKAQLQENPLVGLAARAVGTAAVGAVAKKLGGGDDDLDEEEDVQPGQQVARVIDGEVQRMNVVRDQGRELSVVDPLNPDRIIDVSKDEVAASEEEGEEEEVGSVYGPTRENWIGAGRVARAEARTLTEAKTLTEARRPDYNDYFVGEAEQVFTVEDEDVDANNPYSVGEAVSEFDPEDEDAAAQSYQQWQDMQKDAGEPQMPGGTEEPEGGDPAFAQKRRGVLRSLRGMNRRLQSAEGRLYDRLADRMKDLMSQWDVKKTSEFTSFREGSVDMFCDLLEGVETGPFYIYFDYTGAGRGPEIIAGPYGTREEADAARVADYGEDRDYYVDPEYVEAEYCDYCGEEVAADGTGHFPTCERPLSESVRPAELPDDLQHQYPSLREQARDGLNGEEAVVMYFPAVSEAESRIEVVQDSAIEQQMANGALMVNEAVEGDIACGSCGWVQSPEEVKDGRCYECGEPVSGGPEKVGDKPVNESDYCSHCNGQKEVECPSCHGNNSAEDYCDDCGNTGKCSCEECTGSVNENFETELPPMATTELGNILRADIAGYFDEDEEVEDVVDILYDDVRRGDWPNSPEVGAVMASPDWKTLRGAWWEWIKEMIYAVGDEFALAEAELPKINVLGGVQNLEGEVVPASNALGGGGKTWYIEFWSKFEEQQSALISGPTSKAAAVKEVRLNAKDRIQVASCTRVPYPEDEDHDENFVGKGGSYHIMDVVSPGALASSLASPGEVIWNG